MIGAQLCEFGVCAGLLPGQRIVRTVPDGGTIPEDRVDYDQELHRSWRLSHPHERDRCSKYSMQMQRAGPP